MSEKCMDQLIFRIRLHGEIAAFVFSVRPFGLCSNNTNFYVRIGMVNRNSQVEMREALQRTLWL